LQQELQFSEDHDSDEQNAHQNVIKITTNAIIILILIIFTYSDSKRKLIMLENNINNLNENLIK
jgi:hypothetical protein